ATTVGLAGAGTLTYANVQSLTVNGLGGNDSFLMTGINAATGTTLYGGADNDSFTGNFPGTFAGNLTLNGFENATVTIGTLSGRLTDAGGPITNANVSSISATGLLEVTEVPPGPNAGLLSNSAFGTISGRLLAGSIVNTTIGSVAPGGSVTAQGQGTA